MVDYSGLENRRAERHRGFESLPFRDQSLQSLFAGFFCIPTPHNFTTPPLRSFPIISSAINLNHRMRDMDYGSASLRYESPVVDDGNPVTTELIIKSD